MVVSSLRWRLVAIMSLAYIVVALTTLIAGYNSIESNLRGQLQARASADAAILAAGSLGPLTGGSSQVGTLQTFVASLKRAQGVSYAVVTLGNGVVVGSTRGSDLHKRIVLRIVPKPTAFRFANGDVEGIAPIVQTTLLGQAAVILSSSSIQRDLHYTLAIELLVRVAGLLIFLLLSLVIAQYILGPLAHLARAARAIRRGDLATRVRVVDGTELGTVAAAFNDMASSLEHRIRHLSFLARSGSVLPNTFRDEGDVQPILSSFCSEVGAIGACLMPDSGEGESRICYPEGQGDDAWFRAGRDAVVRGCGPTPVQINGFTVMAVPVLGDATFVAVRAGDRRFAQEEQQVISNFAYQIGIAADNARLFEAQQEALRVKDQFLSIVSHELRTPLTTIKGYAQMLHHKLVEDPQGLRFADNIDAQVDRLSRLVDDLLDVTRFARGQFDVVPEWVNLRALLEEVVGRFRLVSPNYAIVLNLDEGSYNGYWDRDRLEQVLNNLIGNAIKYSPDGGTITVTTRRDDDAVLVSIQDEGIGIPERDLDHLFERFFRGSAEGQDVKGMGLGLYVTRRIVEAHHGSIGVRSKPGYGSEFWFTLPLQPQPATSARG